jgi:hypothetical protein
MQPNDGLLIAAETGMAAASGFAETSVEGQEGDINGKPTLELYDLLHALQSVRIGNFSV